MIEQGEIYDYDFGIAVDSRQSGYRPAIVVQTDLLNRVEGYPLCVIVPVSTKNRSASPSRVRLEPSPENGLSEMSFAKCEQIFTVPQAGLSKLRGKLSKHELYAVKEALRVVLAL